MRAARLYDAPFMEPKHLIIKKDGPVGLIQLHRPDALNALSLDLMIELVTTLETFDADPDVRCAVLAGSQRVFAAGADIKDMAEATVAEMIRRNQFARW